MLLCAYVVLFSRAALRSVSLIRRCQPGPLRRKCAITSGSSRSDTSVLVLSAFGRPRIGFPALCQAPRAKSASVSWGISRYSSRVMAWLSLFFMSLPVTRFLSVIGFPHRNDVSCIATRCPDDNHHPLVQMSDANDPCFAVVMTHIRNVDRHAGKYLDRISEIQAALSQRLFALGRVEGDLHGYSVATKMAESKIFVATEKSLRRLSLGAAA